MFERHSSRTKIIGYVRKCQESEFVMRWSFERVRVQVGFIFETSLRTNRKRKTGRNLAL